MEDSIRIYVKKIPDPDRIDSGIVRGFPTERRERILRQLEKAAEGKKAAGRAAAESYAGGLLLAEVLNVRKDADLRVSENGKPYLADGSCFFSLSHSSSVAVLAVSPVEIGIDTEPIRDLTDSLIRKVFTEEERQFIKEDPVRNPVILWTRLEALLKLSGEGIAGIDTRTVSLLAPEGTLNYYTVELGDSFISLACKKKLPSEFISESSPVFIRL